MYVVDIDQVKIKNSLMFGLQFYDKITLKAGFGVRIGRIENKEEVNYPYTLGTFPNSGYLRFGVQGKISDRLKVEAVYNYDTFSTIWIEEEYIDGSSEIIEAIRLPNMSLLISYALFPMRRNK